MAAIGELAGRMQTMTVGSVAYRALARGREKVEGDVAAQAIAALPRQGRRLREGVRLRRLRDPRGRRHRHQRAAATAPVPMMRDAGRAALSSSGEPLSVEPGKALVTRDRQRHGADEMTNATDLERTAPAPRAVPRRAGPAPHGVLGVGRRRRNDRVLVCVHGLSRQGRDFDTWRGRCAASYRVVCPDVVGRGESDWLADPAALRDPGLRRRHGDAARAARREPRCTGSARRWAA